MALGSLAKAGYSTGSNPFALPAPHDFDDCGLIVALEILHAAPRAHVAGSAAFRFGVFPDVIVQAASDKLDAPAVVIFTVGIFDPLPVQVGQDLLKTHQLQLLASSAALGKRQFPAVENSAVSNDALPADRYRTIWQILILMT